MLNLASQHSTTLPNARSSVCVKAYVLSLYIHTSSSCRVLLTPHLRLAGPDGIGNTPDELQLLPHILVTQGITFGVGCKSALWADAALLDGIFARLTGTLRNVIGCLIDPGDHLILVLKLGELGSDDTKDDVLVLGKMRQRLETSSAWCVEFQVVRIDVEVLS
jgi:hypothetical protein